MNQQIVIFHINDTHARVSTDDENGAAIGIDKISKVVNLSLLKNKNTLFMHGGDMLHGTSRINLSNGENMIKLLNPMHLNCAVTGNHEYNMGLDQLINITKQLKPYILSANTVYKDTKQPVFLPYIIYELDVEKNDFISINSNYSRDDNIRIGVFGLATPETAYKTHPDNVKNVEFLNPIKTAESMVKTLKNYCDIIVALTHLGIDNSSEFTSIKLAENVQGVDYIIDGHSHHVLENGLKINDTMIFQAGSHGKYLGKITIDIRDKKIVNTSYELLNETIIDNIIHNRPDTLIHKTLKSIDDETDRLLNRTIAYCTKTLLGDRTLVRQKESELGNFVANACKYFTNADFSVVNGGDLRASLVEGPVTYKNILDVLPFQNNIQVIEISGQIVKAMFEHSVEFVPASFGGFLSVSSNVKLSFDPSKQPGQRISSIYIDDELIDDDKFYTVSLSSFLVAGGDDYKMLIGSKKIKEFDSVENIVVKFINECGINRTDYQLGRIIVF